jgi:predicted dehydrogenase
MAESVKPVKVGVVGVGYLGKFHVQKYAAMEGAELVGIVDSDPHVADDIARQNRTRVFASHREMIDAVDAVSIVVPTRHHFSISREFLDAGKDVLIEKPMTETLEEAEILVDLAETRGAVLQVGHLERFNPAVVALKGHIRRPLFIESHRLSLFKGRGTDVSVVLDLMIHDIDIILHFVGLPPAEIRASGVRVISDHVDIANARLEFDSGCVANITASRISIKNERKVRIFQKDAYLSVDFGNHAVTVIDKKGEVEEDPESLIPGLRVHTQAFEQSDALFDELASFISAVRGRTVPEVTGRMGMDALATALKVMEQIEANTRSHMRYEAANPLPPGDQEDS